MTNIKTPIIRPFRTQGGTFCSFNSAIEDIGLNINENSNKIRLSHYVVMDIPNCDYTDKTELNKFNLLTPYDSFYKTINDEHISAANSVNSNIAQSFMSYALNMEAVIRNQKNKNSKYDFSSHLSISERVFWKWLKETGAIRWQKASTYKNGKELDKKNDTYFIEEQDSSIYRRVVKGFGAIDAVAQRSSDYGMYNEIYVNIPSSFGKMKDVFFKQVEDNNYKSGTIYTANVNNFFNLEGYEDKGTTFESGLENIGYFDYSDIDKKDSNFAYFTNDTSGAFWFGAKPVSSEEFNAYYITDKNVKGDKVSLNDTIKIKDVSTNDILFQIKRSKLDCVTLELEPNNIAQILDVDNITYDELNINDNNESNYYFNTILVYYSIYDDNDNILATNLYGVYFIDSPLSNNEYIYNSNFTNFEIPRLRKVKSSIDGFGTSYSFKLNIRTASLYDTNTDVYDDSSSENSIVNDFNDVVANLNKSIELLSIHTKNSEILQNKYAEMYELFNRLNNKLLVLEQNYNNITNYEEKIKELEDSITETKNTLEELQKQKTNIVYFKQKI